MKILKTSILLGSIAIIGVTGCGTANQSTTEATVKSTETVSQTEAAAQAGTEAVNTESTENQTDPNTKQLQYQAYKQILMNFLNQKYLPEYGDMTDAVEGDLSENTFAIADIDGDGSDELLVAFTAAATAAQAELIYDYNPQSKTCYKEFVEYPVLSFYQNGAIEAGWSHNQGNAGDFWPYTLYTYDKDKDSYSEAGTVDAYDKKVYEQNKDSLANNPFPEDIDTDKNGFVYYLSDKDTSDTDAVKPVDDSAYQDWLKKYTNGTEKITVDYQALTAENVSKVNE